MTAARKSSIIEFFSKTLFFWIWCFVKNISPKTGRKILYWALTDNSFLTHPTHSPVLGVNALGKHFSNPIGVAAGFDATPTLKYNDTLIDYGFGFAEFGTFTLERESTPTNVSFIASKKAVIVDDRYHTNPGVRVIQRHLVERRRLPHIAGISISSNYEPPEGKQNTDIFEKIEQELLQTVTMVAPYCDYITLNLSHASLPISNLLVSSLTLERILVNLKERIKKQAPITLPRLLVKIPCDLPETSIKDLAEAFVSAGIDGLIIGGYLSSKRERKRIISRLRGNVCGQPIKDLSTALIEKFYQAMQGKVMIIACGGVFTGEDAFEKIKSGATLIQLHSALLYEGPEIVNKINRKLANLLQLNGFKSVQDAVGYFFHRE